MVKLVVLYRKPEDPAAFDHHYFAVHRPLALQYPGLRRLEVARVTGSPAGESEFYLMAELYWDSVAGMQAAFASPEGKAVYKDTRNLGQHLMSMHFAEVAE